MEWRIRTCLLKKMRPTPAAKQIIVHHSPCSEPLQPCKASLFLFSFCDQIVPRKGQGQSLYRDPLKKKGNQPSPYPKTEIEITLI